MMMVTMRAKMLRRIPMVCGLVAVLVLGVLFLPRGANAVETATAPAEETPLKSAEDLAQLLRTRGVAVDITGAGVTTVTVPRKWDDDFEAFNNVVKLSGYDLREVKNKNVDKWLLLCPDKCSAEQKTYAVVLVRNEKPVGMYFLEQPGGNVSPLEAKAPTEALTTEELEASATFGTSMLPVDAAADAVPEAQKVQGDAEQSDAEGDEIPVQAPAEDAMPTE